MIPGGTVQVQIIPAVGMVANLLFFFVHILRTLLESLWSATILCRVLHSGVLWPG